MKNLKFIPVDFACEGSANEFMDYLTRICDEFKMEIVGLIPYGPGGGNPELTFRGEEENLRKFIDDFFDGCGDPDYFDEYSYE